MPKSKIVPDHSLRSLFSTAEYAGLYSFADALPNATGTDIVSGLYNLGKSAMTKWANGGMHAHGLATFDNSDNPIPLANKIVQNFWSFGHMLGGVTDVGAVYTYRHQSDTREVPIYFQRKAEEAPTDARLFAEAMGAYGQFDRVGREMMSRIPPNETTFTANVYYELTDGDIYEQGNLPDPSRLVPDYLQREVWAICQHGRRSIVTTIPDPVRGGEIIKYERPTLAIAKHMLSEDLLYTTIDWAFEPLEKYFTGLSGQRMYTQEERLVGKAVMSANPGWNTRNPLYEYISDIYRP